MISSLNKLRTVQAAGVAADYGSRSVGWLGQILYLSDRASLLKTGAPITGSLAYCSHEGPILGETHGVLLTYRGAILSGNSGDGELSDFDVDTIRGLSQQHRRNCRTEMVRSMRALPEWRDPGKGYLTRLSPWDIMIAAGISGAEVADLACEQLYYQDVDAYLQLHHAP